jgi:hypothetical protein
MYNMESIGARFENHHLLHSPVVFAASEDHGSQCSLHYSGGRYDSETFFASQGHKSKSQSMEVKACKQKCKETYQGAIKECKNAYKECKKPAKEDKKSCRSACKKSSLDFPCLSIMMSVTNPRASGRTFL